MSIFDKRSGFDSGPWLREKTLACLRDVAELVDLANEPDTTPWYARRLRRVASGLVSRLAPLTLYVNGANEGAVKDAEWNAITEHGTLALAAWCERWRIADAKFLALPTVQDGDEDDKDAMLEDRPAVDDDIARTLDRRLELLGLLCRRLLNEDLPDPARRLLVFLMGHLRYSPHADIVVVSKRFLPGDVGVPADDAGRAYEILYERELVERVDALTEGAPDGLALRLVVEDFNDRKQRPAYRPETFGYPGARIGGKPTIGNVLTLRLPAFVQGSLKGWAVLSDDDRAALRVWLQEALGSQRAFMEEVAVVDGQDGPVLEVKLRLPIDESDSDLQSILVSAAESWLRRHVAGLSHDHGSAP